MAHFTNEHKGKRNLQSDHHDRKAGMHAFKVTATHRHKRRKARWMYREQLRMRSEYVYFGD